MKTYLVKWQIELDAENPYHAARLAREIQMDPDSLANCFTVDEKHIDLDRETVPHRPLDSVESEAIEGNRAPLDSIGQ
jgi:hypothetical protein